MSNEAINAVKAKLLEINELVLQLDPSIRAASFQILTSTYFPDGASRREQTGSRSEARIETHVSSPVDTSDLGEFISKFDNTKPAENVELLVAWLYSCYGAYPITPREIKELADSCGLIVPSRSDNTMRTAKKNGKNLFTQQGNGWKPTVSGEMNLKETYGVRKGNKPLPKE